jgi:hypothetical protein
MLPGKKARGPDRRAVELLPGGKRCVPFDARYGHIRDLLRENFSRYGKPLFIAETGIEDKTRPAWLPYDHAPSMRPLMWL